MSVIQRLGRFGIDSCTTLGQAGVFLLRVLVQRPQWRRVPRLVSEQVYSIGVLSFLIILVSSVFIGMVVSLQGYNTLSKFGATQQLGQLLALSVTRELGPVVSALLFAGRAGSALTAEIGLMKATEQLDSMEMMGVNPLWRVMFPRFWAGVIALPILAAIFSAFAILGGYLVGVAWLGVDAGSFWNNMQSAVNFRIDVVSGMIKSLIFGVVCVWIALFQGYQCVPTALGVGRATTHTVVYSSLAVLGLDFILTTMMLGDW